MCLVSTEMASTSSTSAVCQVCKKIFALDIVLSNLEEHCRNLFIQEHADTFQCKDCFGPVPTAYACREHLIALKTAFTQQSENCFKDLYKAAERMKLLMTAYQFFTKLPNPSQDHFRKWPFPVDHNALNYLAAFGDVRTNTHTAFEVSKDGDCLFNTVSQAFWKTEGHSTQLRLRMALEIITERSRYDMCPSENSAYVLTRSFSLFETYFQFVEDSLTIARYMTPSHIAALANALCVPIQLSIPVTPADSSIKDHLSSQMNAQIPLSCAYDGHLDTFCRGWSLHTTTSETVRMGDSHAHVCSLLQNHYCLLVSLSLFRDTTASTTQVELSDEVVSSNQPECSDEVPSCNEVDDVLCFSEVGSDDEMMSSVNEYCHSDHMFDLLFGKPLKATQMLHELVNVDKSKITSDVLTFNANMAGKYYFSMHNNCTTVHDNFNNFLPSSYNNRFSKKRAYTVQHGKYIELKKNGTSYTFNNGLPLTQEHIDSMLFLHSYRVNYEKLARVACCLTDSAWKCSSPLLIMYPCESGRAFFHTSTEDKSSSAANSSFNTSLQGLHLDLDSISNASSRNGSPIKVFHPCQMKATSSPSHSFCATTNASPVQISNVSLTSTSEMNITSTNSVTNVNLSRSSPDNDESACKGNEQLRYLSPLCAYDAITYRALALVPEVPVGPKNNVRFLVSGEYSISKTTGKHIYVDDVFVHSVGRTKTSYYLMPSRVLLTKCGDTFCGPKGVGGIVKGEIVKIIRRKSTLPCGLARCVTTIVMENSPTVHPVLWEYSGEGVHEIHPNQLRTHPNKIAAILPVLKHAAPKILYQQTIVSGGVFRDTEQLSNAKRRALKKDIERAGGCVSSVFAEQVLAMIKSQTTKQLPIYTAVCLPNEPFAFNLAYDYVFQDICRFCLSDKALLNPPAQTKRDNRVRKLTVLGIDKTFNLTPCHVTTIVYKNLSLLHNKTNSKGKNPYFLGPILIHQTSTEEVFRRFLTDIDIRFVQNGYKPNVGPQVVVCDGELAIRNAVKAVWPQTAIYHCHQHLKGNLRRQLIRGKDNNVLHKTARKLLEDNVFYRTECLGSKKSVAAFNARKYEVLESVGNADADDESGTQAYLDEVLFPKLIENIQILEKFPDMDLHMLTNNPTESLNNELKRRGGFQEKSLTEFSKLLKVHEYEFRMNETFRAVLGTGDYRLSSYFAQEFSEPKTRAWYSYSNQKVYDEDKKNKFFAKLEKTPLPLNHCLGEAGGLARSTTADGSLVTLVPRPRAARKPGVKRQSNTKEANSAPKNKAPRKM